MTARKPSSGDPIVADPQPQDITILQLSDGLWHSIGKGSTVLLSPAMQCYKLVTNRQDRASIIDGSVEYRDDWVWCARVLQQRGTAWPVLSDYRPIWPSVLLTADVSSQKHTLLMPTFAIIIGLSVCWGNAV